MRDFCGIFIFFSVALELFRMCIKSIGGLVWILHRHSWDVQELCVSVNWSSSFCSQPPGHIYWMERTVSCMGVPTARSPSSVNTKEHTHHLWFLFNSKNGPRPECSCLYHNLEMQVAEVNVYLLRLQPCQASLYSISASYFTGWKDESEFSASFCS
jgi:hypothetical protein